MPGESRRPTLVPRSAEAAPATQALGSRVGAAGPEALGTHTWLCAQHTPWEGAMGGVSIVFRLDPLNFQEGAFPCP